MPIQLTSPTPLLSNEDQNPFLNRLSKGLQLGLGFPKQLQHADIVNALAQLQSQVLKEKLPYISKMLAADLGLKNLKLENPLLGMPGPAGQIGAAMWAAGHPSQDEYGTNLSSDNQEVNQPNKSSLSYSDNRMTPNEQQEYFNQLAGRTGGQASPVEGATIPINQVSGNQNMISRVGRNYSKMIMDANLATLNSKIIDANLKSKQEQGYTWAHMPAETRNGIVAQGLGMGIDPAEMQQEINKGKTIKQIAKEHGLDPDNLPPAIYFPTTATKTRVQQVQQVGNELDYVASKVSAAIKPYADTWTLPFLGTLSPKAIKDQFGSKEEQKRYGRYIGAMSLQTGLSTGRALLEGTTRPGVEVMREVKNSALKGIAKISPIHMTQTMFDEAQKFINETLKEGARIRTMSGMSPLSQPGNKSQESNEDPLGLL